MYSFKTFAGFLRNRVSTCHVDFFSQLLDRTLSPDAVGCKSGSKRCRGLGVRIKVLSQGFKKGV